MRSKTKLIAFRIDKDILSEIDQIANMEKANRTYIIRNLLKRSLLSARGSGFIDIEMAELIINELDKNFNFKDMSTEDAVKIIKALYFNLRNLKGL